jgi:hypothetical protein
MRLLQWCEVYEELDDITILPVTGYEVPEPS